MVAPAAFFLELASQEPVIYVSIVFTVIVSVVLHELGHAAAAIWQGDDTPRAAGHLTLDPLKHMGGLSLVMLFLIGIAWGQTPVNPSRFRSRHGDALVSAAGPLVNLLLAVLGLTGLGLWLRLAGGAETEMGLNFRLFLFYFGSTNVVLFLFNLLPIPPLDGSGILGSFSPPYRRWVTSPHSQGLFMLLFLAVFLGGGGLFELSERVATRWVSLVAGGSPLA